MTKQQKRTGWESILVLDHQTDTDTTNILNTLGFGLIRPPLALSSCTTQQIHKVFFFFLPLPAFLNVPDGHQISVVLQTLQDCLNSSFRGAEGGLRAGALLDGTLIIRQGGCCRPQVGLQLVQLSGHVGQLRKGRAGDVNPCCTSDGRVAVV